MKKKTISFLITGLLIITIVACNKKVKETTETKETTTSTAVRQNKDKDRPPTMDEAVMEDAIKLVKATCNMQRAKIASQKDPNNSFKKLKFTNLRKFRNEIGEEMKRKYDNHPDTKQMFEEAKTKARESLKECEGLQKPE